MNPSVDATAAGVGRLRFVSNRILARLKTWVRSNACITLVALAGIWVMLFDSLRGEWSINPQYNFGWLVPLLSVILFWRLWPDRPAAVPPGRSLPQALLAGFLLFLLLPSRMILEGNPEWRLIYWMLALQIVGLSFCALYQAGGWKWVRYFAFPVLFTLIAVPWPMGLEQTVIQGLMRLVAGLTVELVGWLGIPAVQRGNLVEVGTGIVGIDEACSGVRSLQSALMISLFLGELFRLSVPRRVTLFLGSVAFVLVANTGRTTFLVWAAAERGLDQMEAWHDMAGNLVMWIVLAGLMALAWLMKPRVNPAVAVTTNVESACASFTPRWVAMVVLGWLVVTEAATECWYRLHERQLLTNTEWSVAWPTEYPQFKRSSLPENALAILRCSESESAAWQDEDGNRWSAFLLRWDAGKNSAQLAKGHQPEICLTSAGAELIDDIGLVRVPANGVELTFRHQTFESRQRLLHVFYCLWADRIAPGDLGLIEDGSRASRIQVVISGKRHLGQQVLEIVIEGPDSAEKAEEVLKTRLPFLVQPRKASQQGSAMTPSLSKNTFPHSVSPD